MIRLHIQLDSAGDGILIMPLNDGERVGFAETVIEYDESTIPPPFQENILAELLKPIGERGPGFAGNSWKAVVSPSDKARIERRNDVKLGRQEGHRPHTYFYSVTNDEAIAQGNPVIFPNAIMFKTVNGPFGNIQTHADASFFTYLGVDYYGPTTSADALSRVITPPEGP